MAKLPLYITIPLALLLFFGCGCNPLWMIGCSNNRTTIEWHWGKWREERRKRIEPHAAPAEIPAKESSASVWRGTVNLPPAVAADGPAPQAGYGVAGAKRIDEKIDRVLEEIRKR